MGGLEWQKRIRDATFTLAEDATRAITAEQSARTAVQTDRGSLTSSKYAKWARYVDGTVFSATHTIPSHANRLNSLNKGKFCLMLVSTARLSCSKRHKKRAKAGEKPWLSY